MPELMAEVNAAPEPLGDDPGGQEETMMEEQLLVIATHRQLRRWRKALAALAREYGGSVQGCEARRLSRRLSEVLSTTPSPTTVRLDEIETTYLWGALSLVRRQAEEATVPPWQRPSTAAVAASSTH
jgi:hypothetical protein